MKNFMKRFSILRKISYLMTSPPNRGLDAFLSECNSIVHIGANKGQERFLYEHLGLNVLWIEALPSMYCELERNIKSFSRQKAACAALADLSGKTVDFHVANNEGASSSMFDFHNHVELWPEVHMIEKIQLRTKTLDEVVPAEEVIDALVIDTQGAELLVLEGGLQTLKKVSYVKAEAADFDAYSGACTLSDLDEFMHKYGFVEVGRDSFANKEGVGSYYDVVWRRVNVTE